MVTGILIAHYFVISTNISLYTTFGFLFCLSSLLLIFKKRHNKTTAFSLFSFITMVFIGVLTTNLHNEKRNPRHYSKVYNSEHSITFKINSSLKANTYNNKYTINILKVGEQSVSGTALLNVSKDSTNTDLKVDAIYTTHQPLQDIGKLLNPNQFDYKYYLEKQYIYHQIYSSKNQLLLIENKPYTFYGYADLFRNTIKQKLESSAFKPDELAIINAIILGQRQDINSIIQNQYTNAGVVHILAVSGLHVGILLFLLNGLLYPLIYLKRGKTLKIVLTLLALWSFAVIAGLSASIIRAVTMFSLIAIAMHLKRVSNIYNTLASSIFILLLFKPLFIFDIGFQLSYLAVFAIVTIQPLIVKLWSPKPKIFKWFWDIFTVTLAAQFGVIPISLFYFHQFPSLFFISNLVIIPFLELILALGILIIVLALCNALPHFLAKFYGYIISTMNQFVAWVAQLDSFVFTDISFNIIQLLSSYLLIFSFVRLVIKPNYKRLYVVLIAFLCFQGSFIVTKYTTSSTQLTIFHKRKHTIIGYKNNTALHIYSDLDSVVNNKMLNNYKVANNISYSTNNRLDPIYNIDSNQILIVDSLGLYNLKAINPTYVLLRQSPKINLERLIKRLQPKYVIADGSNYKSYINRWKTICKKEKLPFHNTNEKGAFIISTD